MSKIFIAFLILFYITTNYTTSHSNAESTSPKPNIVLIVSDDHGYGDTSAYFHKPEVHTPNIDRLAAMGVRLTNGYASGNVCSPTRAGLLTGRYQQRFGFYRAPDSRTGLPKSEITLADLLKSQGYTTGIFGKWHLGLEPAYHPLERGFDEFYGFLGHGGHDYFDLKTDPNNIHNAMYRNKEVIEDTGYLTDNLAREATAFIERNKDKPFFCYLPFNAVHAPLQAPENDIKEFNTGDNNRDIYLAMLKRMDIAIGQVLDTLEKNKCLDNTLIIFLSDNGGARKNAADNGKLRDFKQSFYEGGIRVPFIFAWPGQLEPKTTNDEPIICMDVLPTVCDAIGQPLPTDRIYDGKSVLPNLRGTSNAPLHDTLYWSEGGPHWSIRQHDWKLTLNKKGALELYNLKNDLSEENNLSAKQPEKVQELHTKYKKWLAQMAPSIRPQNATNQKPRKRKK